MPQMMNLFQPLNARIEKTCSNTVDRRRRALRPVLTELFERDTDQRFQSPLGRKNVLPALRDGEASNHSYTRKGTEKPSLRARRLRVVQCRQ